MTKGKTSSKSELRNPKQIQNPNDEDSKRTIGHSDFVLGICSGFRASDFDFLFGICFSPAL